MVKNFIIQLVKYGSIGFVNFLINVGVLNLLMYITNITSGFTFYIFVAISFIIYSTNGYLMNKKFTFKYKANKNPYFQYLAVMGTAAFFNATIISTLTLFNIFKLSPRLWANVVILLASMITGLCSFLINKLVIFKNKVHST